MSGTFKIRVVDSDGDGLENISVGCQYGSCSGVEIQDTDEDGWAEFPVIEETIGNGNIVIRKIWIGRTEVGDEYNHFEDGDTVSFTLPEEEE